MHQQRGAIDQSHNSFKLPNFPDRLEALHSIWRQQKQRAQILQRAQTLQRAQILLLRAPGRAGTREMCPGMV